jgi:GxxExxY protein
MNTDQSLPNKLSERIIGCALIVWHALCAGCVERVYEGARAHELRIADLALRQQHGLTVMYDGIVVGEYVVTVLVEQAVLVELKSLKAVHDIHRARRMNYLRATGVRLCLLLNLGNPRLAISRLVRRRPGSSAIRIHRCSSVVVFALLTRGRSRR